MRFVDACFESMLGIVVIFCMKNMEPPTRIGRTRGEGSGSARSSHRKELFKGIALCTWGSQEYRYADSPTRLSGVDGKVCRRDRYSPIHIGNCTNIGPRHPSGFTPFSR